MSLKKNAVTGILWTSLDKFGIQIIQFILGIVIARILSPEDYGIVGISAVFIALSQVFIDSGFGKSLIQNNKPTSLDLSTVFYFNLFLSIICYLFIFLSAPYIASFYNLPILKDLTRVIGISLIIQSFGIVPNALFSINLNFKPLAISNAFASIIGGIIGLYAAYSGYGVWSLVIMSLVVVSIRTISHLYLSNWCPIFEFSITSLRKLFKFGGNLLVSSLIDVATRNASALIIGKIYSTKQLGFYTKGVDVANTISNSIISVLFAVLFPSFSILKEDKKKLLGAFKKSLRYISLLVLPVFFLIFILAKPLIIVLLTDKWVMAGVILQYLVLARMINMIALLNVQVLHGIGRSDITLKQEILKSILRLVFILLFVKFGIIWIAIGELIATIINYFINSYPLKAILNFGFIKQLNELKIIITSSVIATVICFLCIRLIENNYLKLLSAPAILFSIYLALLFIFKQPDLMEMRLRISKKYLKKIN